MYIGSRYESDTDMDLICSRTLQWLWICVSVCISHEYAYTFFWLVCWYCIMFWNYNPVFIFCRATYMYIHRCDKTTRWGNVPWFISLTYEHGCHSWCIHTPFQMVVAGCCWCFFTRFRGKLSIFTETDTFFFALATIVTRHKWYCASVFFHIQKALLML